MSGYSKKHGLQVLVLILSGVLISSLSMSSSALGQPLDVTFGNFTANFTGEFSDEWLGFVSGEDGRLGNWSGVSPIPHPRLDDAYFPRSFAFVTEADTQPDEITIIEHAVSIPADQSVTFSLGPRPGVGDDPDFFDATLVSSLSLRSTGSEGAQLRIIGNGRGDGIVVARARAEEFGTVSVGFASGVLEISDRGSLTVEGEVSNSGQISLSSSSFLGVGGDLRNSGDISLDGSTLSLAGSIQGPGTISLDDSDIRFAYSPSSVGRLYRLEDRSSSSLSIAGLGVFSEGALSSEPPTNTNSIEGSGSIQGSFVNDGLGRIDANVRDRVLSLSAGLTGPAGGGDVKNEGVLRSSQLGVLRLSDGSREALVLDNTGGTISASRSVVEIDAGRNQGRSGSVGVSGGNFTTDGAGYIDLIGTAVEDVHLNGNIRVFQNTRFLGEVENVRSLEVVGHILLGSEAEGEFSFLDHEGNVFEGGLFFDFETEEYFPGIVNPNADPFNEDEFSTFLPDRTNGPLVVVEPVGLPASLINTGTISLGLEATSGGVLENRVAELQLDPFSGPGLGSDSGRIRLGEFETEELAITGSGTIRNSNGDIVVRSGTVVTITDNIIIDGGRLLSQQNGRIDLEGATLDDVSLAGHVRVVGSATGKGVIINRGLFEGRGDFILEPEQVFDSELDMFVQVDGMFINEGRLAPGASPGELNIFGDLTLTDTSVLEIEIEGSLAGEFDTLNVFGDLIVGGELLLNFENYTPSAGDEFLFLTFDSITGQFDNIAIGGSTTTTDGRFSFDLNREGQTFLLSNIQALAVPEPSSSFLLLVVGLVAAVRRKRTNLSLRLKHRC